MSEKLYYTEPHTRSFSARVLSCEPTGELWSVRLDRSAFFPGGGGQAADTGTIGAVRVVGGREEDGEPVALTDAALEPGAELVCELDWPQRFARMQLHSGEHVVSGLAHRYWGCENVGFHMAEDCVAIDFDRELSAEQLAMLERAANECVWANVPFHCYFPAAEELSALDYRSKKELSGAVRIVEIPGIDRCACCAPHVERSGEIGLIRIVESMRHRGGVRLTVQTGACAYEAAAAEARQTAQISGKLSAPRDALLPALERVLGELEREKLRAAGLSRELLARRAAETPETDGVICLFEETEDLDALRELVNALTAKCRLCAVFAGSEGAWKYILGSKSVDLRALAPKLNRALSGRGGGSAGMIRGGVTASRSEIETFFAETEELQ